MTHRFYKHKLLLDEGFHHRSSLPVLNSRFDVKHVAADYKQVGIPDLAVYDMARREHRIVITYNTKDFKPLVPRSTDTGVIGVSQSLSTHQIDTKLTALLLRSTETDLLGKLTTITGES